MSDNVHNSAHSAWLCATRSNPLQHTVTHCMQQTATHQEQMSDGMHNSAQKSEEHTHTLCTQSAEKRAAHCNTWQHTITHWVETSDDSSCLTIRQSCTRCQAARNTLQHIATHCNTLQQARQTTNHAKGWKYLYYTTYRRKKKKEEGNTLHHSTTSAATRNSTLQHTATHCNTLQHTATHYSTLQHTATPCNTLQRTATHCNTLQHTEKRRLLMRTILHTFLDPKNCKIPQHTEKRRLSMRTILKTVLDP